MILTPEQIETIKQRCGDNNLSRAVGLPDSDAVANFYLTAGEQAELFQTLAAYAEIVERLSESDFPGRVWRCPFCPAILDDVPPEMHAPDCLYLAARRLRGKA